MSTKRSFENLADIKEDQNGVELHFGIETVSPMKKGRSGIPYYDGQVNDGSRTLRLVGFDEASQLQMTQIVEQ